MIKFVYNRKEYTLDELINDYNTFSREVELPNDLTEYSILKPEILVVDKGYAISVGKLDELYGMIASARNALILSYQKFYDSNIISFESGEIGQLWMRAEYLKNAIVWYNSCEDYIYQIIWFAYELHGKSISNREEYEKALKECTYGKVKNKVGEFNNENSKLLLELINNYRNDDQVKYLRENLANNLKHRANLAFEELYSEDIMTVYDGSLNISEIVKPNLVSIDETIDIVKSVHIKLVKLARDIKEYINFTGMLVFNSKGEIDPFKHNDKPCYRKLMKE
ncbi:hypothetical protein QTI42_07855 [Clostridium perfringens]|uniref:hypothetical protein n=1 Tax=Clostridium perfringens TaxID=1502 RepID=UPI00232EC2AD|nr:hypothetical protein [Clostridium perfringens]MDB2051958.1 hypothetical protein [Clostridium perfringens]MDM0850002.1 hypothetical protein [Clostridium perfringens]